MSGGRHYRSLLWGHLTGRRAGVAYDAPHGLRLRRISADSAEPTSAYMRVITLAAPLSISSHCRPRRKCCRARPGPTDRTILECRARQSSSLAGAELPI